MDQRDRIPARPYGLGESHLRRITSTLVLIDQRLDEIERWASGPLPSGPLYRWRQDLDPATLKRIALEARKVREELVRIIERLDLQPQERVASRAIQTGAIFSLVELEELEPRRMRAYGALTEEQAGLFGEIWGPLNGPLEEIRRLCGAPGAGGAASSSGGDP
jgi:hypothetical protein